MNVAPERCDQCDRRPARHGHKARQQRPCGPLTGTAAGPMSPDERERYLGSSCTCDVDGWPCPDCQERF